MTNENNRNAWGELSEQDAKRMPRIFAEGSSEPIAAKIWGSEFGNPHGELGMNEGEVFNVFDGLSHDELAGVVVFAGPTEHVRKFVLDSQAWVDRSWRNLGESENGVDCLALCVWDDGRGWSAAGAFRSADVGWELPGGSNETFREIMKFAEDAQAAAGCGHVGEYGTATSVAESIEEEGEDPPEVAEAVLLMMGETRLVKMVAGIQAGKKSLWPVAETVAQRIMAKREACAIGAETGLASKQNRPKPL